MKTKNYIIAGLAGIILAACTSDMALEEQAAVTYDNHNLLKVEVVDGGSAVTRADYSGFPATTFETGDAIGVYAFDGSSYAVSNIRFVKQSDGSWLPDEEVPYVDGYTYYGYFPYRSTTYSPSTSGTVDAVDTKFANFISDASNYFWKADQSTKADFTYSNLMIAKGTVTDTDDDAVTIKFTMVHKRGLAVFTEDAPDAVFSGNTPYQVGSTMQFLMKPDVATSFTDDNGSYSLTASGGEYVLHNVILPIDLSMVDNAGTKRAAGTRTTANCYLVHAAGDYRLPLVYGNAIKNGSDNRVAYYPGENGSITDGTDQFVNHNDDGITGPWITKSTSGTGVNKGMGLTASSAQLLWQDRTGLITDVSVSGDYLNFSVGTFGAGNALIAVKDGSGNILWSWHIWATSETLASTTSIATGSHTYRVAPVNLGWVPTGGGGKQGYCPYYQWGRKDPFIPAASYSSTSNHTVYNISNSSVTGLTYQASTTATIADNIKNPTYHYYNRSTYGPNTTTYYNMWDAQNTATNNVTSATKKTIYDPCPPGFCVPTGNLWYYFGGNANPTSSNSRSDSNWDSTNKGKTWTLNGASIYFPAAGSRNRSSGSLSYVGSDGFYWSATPSSSNYGRCLNVNSSYWGWNGTIRAFGFSVRPVAEE